MTRAQQRPRYVARHAAPRGPVLTRGETAVLTVRLVLSAAVLTASTAVLSLFVWTLLPLAVGWSPSVVLTGSMLPSIQPGDIVVAAPLDEGEQAAPGHVLRFVDPSRPSRYLLHRVVRVNEDGTYVTRGDANRSEDTAPVPPANVTGIARLRVPLVGLPVVWLHERDYLPLGLAVVALFAAAQLFAGLRTLTDEPDDPDDPDSESDFSDEEPLGCDPASDEADDDLDAPQVRRLIAATR
ncbi:signal peptidase I [Spirilliplanes yamanashiensis]|uniref:signal peptidase I n=1 Tax=Spirilliplanes yamanashiensis TaxID=42233 RepID=UPI00195049CB|nr:signal peptidase I [Spirilliplanes yamanashiensis]MDP9814800.1 signal peptidase I [Spirilliplanes yamanashiensis]